MKWLTFRALALHHSEVVFAKFLSTLYDVYYWAFSDTCTVHHIDRKDVVPCFVLHVISDLQIRVRGRQAVQGLSYEYAHLKNFRPSNLLSVLRTDNS